MEFPLGIIKYLFIHGLLLGGEALPPQLSLGQLPFTPSHRGSQEQSSLALGSRSTSLGLSLSTLKQS